MRQKWGCGNNHYVFSVLGVLGTNGWVWVRIYRGGRAILNALIPLRCARSGIEVPRPRSYSHETPNDDTVMILEIVVPEELERQR